MAQQIPPNAFKVSELRDLANLDDDDVLLISDRENGTYYTRKMTIGRFIQELSLRIKADGELKDAINENVAEAVSDPQTPAAQQVTESVAGKVEEVIEQTVFDASSDEDPVDPEPEA